MQFKQQIAPPFQPSLEVQEATWLNDMGPIPPSQLPPSSMSAFMATAVPPSQRGGQHALPLSEDYIGSEHPLWPIVQRLSGLIWRELHDTAYYMTLTESALVELVRKRVFDLLRSEAVIAHRVRGLAEATSVLRGVGNEVLGYGPLMPLLQDESISEVVVIGPHCTYVERNGQIEEVLCRFVDERHVLRIMENLLRKAGRYMQHTWPIADVRLPDGSLVTVTMPPNAVNGPTITIRRPTRMRFVMTELVERGVLSQHMADFLLACVRARLNLLICGGVGFGKTAFLNALCTSIPAHERIVTIEDFAELRLNQRLVMSLVSRLNSSGSVGRVTMRDLVLHAQRMRPGRIIVGECRGDEVVELLHAMDTGLDGVLTTMYAHNARDCFTRLEKFCLAGGCHLPPSVVRAQIGRSLHVVVHLSRLRDGSRKVTNIVEVLGADEDSVKMQSLFHYRDDGRNEETGKCEGSFEPSGFCPTFFAKFKALGIHVPCEIFIPQQVVVQGLHSNEREQ